MRRLAKFASVVTPVAALVIVAAGCGPNPPHASSGFHHWVSRHLTVVEYDGPKLADPPPECAGHLPGFAWTTFLDRTCVEEWFGGRSQLAFWRAHEECHDVLVHIGLGPFGFGNREAEANANTCAVAVSGVHPAVTDPSAGYIDPTPAQIAHMRGELILAGVAP